MDVKVSDAGSRTYGALLCTPRSTEVILADRIDTIAAQARSR